MGRAEHRVRLGDVQIAAETFGDPLATPVVLVMGATASMLWWPERMCQSIADAGYRVVRYDHRDTGRSTTHEPGDVGYGVDTGHELGPLDLEEICETIAAFLRGVDHHLDCRRGRRPTRSRREHGRGIGRGLLVDAIRRSVRIAEDAGVRALLIHAGDDDARQFYLRQAEFQESPTDPLHLFLHMKQARSLVAGS